MLKRNLLWSAMQAVNPSENGGEGGAIQSAGIPHFPSTSEVLAATDAMAQWEPSSDEKHSFNEDGAEFAGMFLAAEQGIVTAELTLTKTKLEGLIRMAKIPTDMGRVQFLSGMDVKFREADGDKLRKVHQNYLTDLRRVKNAVESVGKDGIIAKLTEKGDYAQRVERIPRQSQAGGQNKGTGTKSANAAASEAIKAHGHTAESVAAALAVPPKPESSEKLSGEVSAVQKRGTTRDKLLEMIAEADESDLEAIVVATANRLKKSPDPQYAELGAMILDGMDAISIREATAQSVDDNPAAPAAVNE